MIRIIFLIILLFTLCSCRESFMHNLTEVEANRILAHLYSHKLSVKKEKQADGRWSLSLPSEQVADGIRILDSNKLLKDNLPEVKEAASFMSSHEQQRFRYERSLSREIETTLSALPAVLQARVHLNLPVSDQLLGSRIDNSASSASVMLISNSADLNREEVVALVAGASGVKAEAVSVVVSLVVEQEKHGSLQPANPAESIQQVQSNLVQPDTSQSDPGQSDFSWHWILELADRLYLPAIFILAVAIIFILVFRQFNKPTKSLVLD